MAGFLACLSYFNHIKPPITVALLHNMELGRRVNLHLRGCHLHTSTSKQVQTGCLPGQSELSMQGGLKSPFWRGQLRMRSFLRPPPKQAAGAATGDKQGQLQQDLEKQQEDSHALEMLVTSRAEQRQFAFQASTQA
eukprot:1151773-Pelagomonas_calceolata.AAC.5